MPPVNTHEALALIAPYPPPRGGVSTHVYRLVHLLDDAGVDFVVYDTTGREEGALAHPRVRLLGSPRPLHLAMFAVRPPAGTVYVCSGRLSLWILGALMSRRSVVALRLQNAALLTRARTRFGLTRLLAFILRRYERIVCVNPLLVEKAKDLGVPEERIRLFPGFLPPQAPEWDPGTVDSQVWAFVDRHWPLVCASGAFALHEGRDLYGFDHLVELAVQTREAFPTLGIVVCLWRFEPNDHAALAAFTERARAAGVEDRIWINTKEGPFLPVLAASDVLVRPTATDGDANTIREAMALGVPVVASDVVPRPPASRLFHFGDYDEFGARVSEILESLDPRSAQEGRPERASLEAQTDEPIGDRYVHEIRSWLADA